MDALDLLIDFASLLSCSTAATNTMSASSDRDNTAPLQKEPVILQGYPNDVPASIRHFHNDMKVEGGVRQQYSTPSPATLEEALLAHLTRGQKCNFEERNSLIDHQSQGPHRISFEQYKDQQLQRSPGSVSKRQDRDAPPWTTFCVLENTVPDQESWVPQQCSHDFYVEEDTRRLVIPSKQLCDTPCPEPRCNCQVIAPRWFHMSTERRPEPMDELRGAGQPLRGYRDGSRGDPQMEAVFSEDQVRFDQTQRY
jgi:hypothetical protein